MPTRAEAEAVLTQRLRDAMAAGQLTVTGASPDPVWSDPIAWGLSAAGFDPINFVSPTDADVGKIISVTDWQKFLDWAEVRALETAFYGSLNAAVSSSIGSDGSYSATIGRSNFMGVYKEKYDQALKQWGYPANYQGGLRTGVITVRDRPIGSEI